MTILFSAEQDLIRRASAGDESAFEHLVKEFTPDLFRVMRRMTADTSEAEAIVQETFWRVWQTWPRYKADRRFFPYLVTIAANLLRDAWRKQRRILPDEFEAVSDRQDTSPLPETQVEEAELLQSLSRSVEGLPPIYRAVIALRYDAELSYEEIASALGLPVNTVRTHLHRAKLALRQTLKEAYG
jgi:RNA polymerase sigma-70 factor (ECF subfamily)